MGGLADGLVPLETARTTAGSPHRLVPQETAGFHRHAAPHGLVPWEPKLALANTKQPHLDFTTTITQPLLFSTSLMKQSLQLAVIGAGLMGGIHADCIARERGARLAGVYNRSPDKARELAGKHGAQVFDSLDELLADDAIDAVVIASPQQAHAEQCIAACKAGKHILCEKPLALTPQEIATVAKAAKRSGIVFQVAHQLRFHPVLAAVRKALPKLGRTFHLDLEMAFRITGSKGRCWEDHHSGGFFMELGCHLADLSRALMGDVRHVMAGTLRLHPDRVTEDFTHALLHFESGALGGIITSANHRTLRQGLLRGRILGERGRIDFRIFPYSRSFNDATIVLDKGRSTFIREAFELGFVRLSQTHGHPLDGFLGNGMAGNGADGFHGCCMMLQSSACGNPIWERIPNGWEDRIFEQWVK